MTAGPRERLVDSAIMLVRERGVHATGLADLLHHSRTARGSIYQHFPGGKAELIEEATRVAGERLGSVIDSLAASGPPDQLIEALVRWWKKTLGSSSYAAGCPVVAAALGGADAPAQVFQAWQDQLAAALTRAGLDRRTARSFGSVVVSTIEGAIILSRATKSPRPLDDAKVHLTRLLRVYLDEG